MANAEVLYNRLKEALERGDAQAIREAKDALILAGRDKELDRGLINSIKEKTLGKNIKRIINNEDVDRLFCMKVISSLLTHIVIEAEINNTSLDDYSIKELYVILGGFVNDKEDAVQSAKKFLVDRYEEFI